MNSRFIKSIAVIGTSFALAGTAFAGGSHHSTLPSLSSWSSHNSTSTSYSTLSAAEADARYGTGSISETYTLDDSYAYSGGTTQISGLGHNESLRATDCPVNVHGTSGEGRVVGCYNVVKPVPQTTYYRVVRPIVYVRYPVHYPVPVAIPSCQAPIVIPGNASRYGGYGPQGGFGGLGQNNFGGFNGGQVPSRGPVCR